MIKYPGQKDGSWRFHYDGFDYRQDNPHTIRTQEYRCKKKGCHGRARHPRDSPENVTVNAIHNHPRETDDFRTWQYRQALKEGAKKDLSTTIVKLFRTISTQYADVAEHVDPVRERRKMRRARRNMLPKCPGDYDELSELLVNDERIKRLYGCCDPVPGSEAENEKFFQTALRNQYGTTLIFASPHLLEKLLSKSKQCKMDATFKVLPMKPKGRQLLSVHATDGIHTFPVIYALMQSKKKASYIQLFEFIKLLCPEWNPEEMTLDFEKSLRDAFGSVYPNCKIIGCYFHFTQVSLSPVPCIEIIKEIFHIIITFVNQ
ncbi:Phosphoenolpyruvate carboxykinase [GTP] [Frankliniella fusca]|uniref:Phosphoenolpyruvate carboxykinase [GTP] n=1 Tax=Frankliniella fusca TaxID=407009 RepID=A0AAE1LJT5_9NEOP|nr:Phosphoenolpyruvate carboxykinase [GTP] [Frankliniella fusca]KAK3920722.1 Phosphoenolpyruvate carboxykinase [GTP] [Frankliniella fusca]